MQYKAEDVRESLICLASEEKARILSRFFKTGAGEYGYGDLFLGIQVPEVRKVALHYKSLPNEEVFRLLRFDEHECRLSALLIWVEQFKKGDEATRRLIYESYLDSLDRINNWDLVDTSAPKIIGEYLKDKEREMLYELADEDSIWPQRVAVVATFTFIRERDFVDILALAERFISHPHDLMHKAVGWMLREMGKRDERPLRLFLDRHAAVMPRTMLRYAIEKFSPEERAYYMNQKKKIYV